MSFLKDRTLIVLSGILFIILLIAVAFYISSNYTITGTGIQHNPQYSNISLNEQQMKVVCIALNDENVKGFLSGRRYAITQTVIQNFSMNKMGSYVLIECMNDDGSLDFHLLVSVDVQNKSVISAIGEKPKPG